MYTYNCSLLYSKATVSFFTDQGVGSLYDGAGLFVNSDSRRGHYCWRGQYIDSGCWGGVQQWLFKDTAGSYIPRMCNYSECD